MSMFNEPYENEISDLRQQIKTLRAENEALKARLRQKDADFCRDEDAEAHQVDYWDNDRDY